MDVIGQYYAPSVKSKRERVTSKDRVDTFTPSSWDEYDIRVRRARALQARLFDLEDARHSDAKTPVFRGNTAQISDWVRARAVEQDIRPLTKPSLVAKAYETVSHAEAE